MMQCLDKFPFVYLLKASLKVKNKSSTSTAAKARGKIGMAVSK
jgi:hypothetical protein